MEKQGPGWYPVSTGDASLTRMGRLRETSGGLGLGQRKLLDWKVFDRDIYQVPLAESVRGIQDLKAHNAATGVEVKRYTFGDIATLCHRNLTEVNVKRILLLAVFDSHEVAPRALC